MAARSYDEALGSAEEEPWSARLPATSTRIAHCQLPAHPSLARSWSRYHPWSQRNWPYTRQCNASVSPGSNWLGAWASAIRPCTTSWIPSTGPTSMRSNVPCARSGERSSSTMRAISRESRKLRADCGCHRACGYRPCARRALPDCRLVCCCRRFPGVRAYGSKALLVASQCSNQLRYRQVRGVRSGWPPDPRSTGAPTKPPSATAMVRSPVRALSIFAITPFVVSFHVGLYRRWLSNAVKDEYIARRFPVAELPRR